MPIRRQSVKVLRNWYRLSLMPELQPLSAHARWWLYGVAMAWSGYNNGVIEFTRRRHAAQYGLSHPEVFERARRDVLDAGLVLMTSNGGSGVPATYALANMPIQATANGTADVPSNPQKDGTADVPSEPKSGTSDVPSRYVSRTIKNGPYKEPRARLNRKAVSKPPRAVSVDTHGATAANPESGQGGDVETQTRVSIPTLGKPALSMV
jgi:hypothetical protein